MLAAASLDGFYAAVARPGELSLYTIEPFVEIARVAIERTGHVMFVGRQVVVHDGARMRVFAVPRLTPIADIEAQGKLVATSGHYALIVRDEVLIASCTGEGAALAPTRAPASVELAVGLENARFMTWPKRGTAEIWDAAARLPTARVALELPPDACAAGTTGKQRSIWIATSAGDLVTSRLSDGKTTVAPLPWAPHEIASHPMSAWLVMDGNGEPHAVNNVLHTWQPLAIPPGRPRTVAPSIGSHAYVIVDEGERVTRHEVGSEAKPPVSIVVGAPLPEVDVEPQASAPTPVKRVETLSTRFAERHHNWREALVQWAKHHDATLPDAPPLAQVADRARLDAASRRMLFALYAEWVNGRESGIPGTWDHAVRLVTSQLGRCKLARSVGTFLDGREPEHVQRIDGLAAGHGGAPTSAPRGAFRASGDPHRLAMILGTLGVAKTFDWPSRLDAWLRGWPLVAPWPGSGVDVMPEETIVFLTDDTAIPSLPGA